MNKKLFIYGILLIFIITICIFLIKGEGEQNSNKYEQIKATVLEKNNYYITVQDSNNIIYKLDVCKKLNKVSAGDILVIEYTGLLDPNVEVQDISIKKVEEGSEKNTILSNKNMFSAYTTQANELLKTMTLEDKIAQILLVKVPNKNASNIVKDYTFGGYLLYKDDFEGKTEDEVKNMIKTFQNNSKIPLLIATDEEGGNVVRVSSNSLLVDTPFKSPKELYDKGGLDLIREDTINKSKVLSNLGINLNLAPVIDVSTNPSSYIYNRTIGQNSDITSLFAKEVISASKNTGVSYTLKHFPGYGDNSDTHLSEAVDTRTYDEIINNDIKPFKAGINAGAEAVLVSHNIINSIDPNNPASLSINVHNILRNDLDFSGIIITDDLSMKALENITSRIIKAINSGNDLLIVTDYENSIKEVKDAITDGILSEEIIDKLALRILTWKYYKGLIIENQK